jgi:hypothetical protein
MSRPRCPRFPGLRSAVLLLAMLAVGACAPRVELPQHDDAAAGLAAFRARSSSRPSSARV